MATGFGGLLSLFGVILLPVGISKIVRAKRAGFSSGITPHGTPIYGVRLEF